MDNYQNHLVLRKVFFKVVPLSPILFNLFINAIFNRCDKYGISIGDKWCYGGLFVDDIVLCAPTRSQLKKLLKLAG
jgi:hypothetical protein